MKCVDVEKFLDDFVNNDVDFAVRREIEAHLRECPFCQSDAEELQTANRLLKNLPPVTPSNSFNARMMQAFDAHRDRKLETPSWSAIFANFSISKPALGFGLLVLAGVSILAFQLGRITSPNSQIIETANINQSSSAENNPSIQIVEKRIEVPIVKIVQIPVHKEKIVNRVIYKSREIPEKIRVSDQKENNIRKTDFDFQNTAVTYIQNGNETFTPINLQNFQPVSEIKMDIIKKGIDNEK